MELVCKNKKSSLFTALTVTFCGIGGDYFCREWLHSIHFPILLSVHVERETSQSNLYFCSESYFGML
jgi:hypothetical protein